MKYRRFGKTNIQMPLISIGAMRFQTSWDRANQYKPESITNLEKIVQKALDNGMNHFETARGYGTSEAELGIVLPNFDRDSMIVQTKIGTTETTQQFLDDLKDSMKTLNVDYLDLLAIHGINNEQLLELVLKKDGILDACDKLKAQGRIRNIGFASHALPHVIQKVIATDRFDYVNLWHSYIYQFNLPVIEEATKRDMGVFIISPNDKGGMLYDPPQKLVDLTAPLSPMMFNDIFILSDERIHTISCGAAVPKNLDEHINAVDNLHEHADLVSQITVRLDKALENVIDADWRQNYQTGLPHFSKTPEGMNIWITLWLWNIYKAFDLLKYVQFRYNLMGNAEHWFAGCKPDTYKQIDKQLLRDALKDSPYTDRIMDILEDAYDIMKSDEVIRLSED